MATVRDIIEILAILAAGIWALYVFAYEQRIKPASEPPQLLLTGSLHRLGEHKGLVQIGFKGTVLNNGRTDASIIGVGFDADGLRYTTSGAPILERTNSGTTFYQRDVRIASRTLVCRIIELTRFASRAYSGGFTLHPGEQIPYSAIFVVKRAEFDSVALYGSLAYTKLGIDGGYPTKVEHASTGAVYFAPAKPTPYYTRWRSRWIKYRSGKRISRPLRVTHHHESSSCCRYYGVFRCCAALVTRGR